MFVDSGVILEFIYAVIAVIEDASFIFCHGNAVYISQDLTSLSCSMSV